MPQFIKKADIVLLIVLVATGIFLFFVFAGTGSSGSEVRVTVDGEVYGFWPLDKDQEITIKQHGHTNKIIIKNSTVQMTFSDCKNQVCVNEGKIKMTNQSIVCLPNRVVVEITEGGDNGYDAFSE